MSPSFVASFSNYYKQLVQAVKCLPNLTELSIVTKGPEYGSNKCRWKLPDTQSLHKYL